jgi:hypothetical protein
MDWQSQLNPKVVSEIWLAISRHNLFIFNYSAPSIAQPVVEKPIAMNMAASSSLHLVKSKIIFMITSRSSTD